MCKHLTIPPNYGPEELAEVLELLSYCLFAVGRSSCVRGSVYWCQVVLKSPLRWSSLESVCWLPQDTPLRQYMLLWFVWSFFILCLVVHDSGRAAKERPGKVTDTGLLLPESWLCVSSQLVLFSSYFIPGTQELPFSGDQFHDTWLSDCSVPVLSL